MTQVFSQWVPPGPSHSDVLIVGGGIFGTSTAYHLSQSYQDPSRITVLDRAPFPSPKAASTDTNKIVRADYSSPFYMDLAYEAMDAWANWPLFKRADVYHRTGWVMVDEKSSDLAERIRKNFRESGKEDVSKDMTFDEFREDWGGVFSQTDLSEFGKAYTNPSAGWADAGMAVDLMMKEAVGKGVRYEVGEAERLILEEDRVKGVETKDGHAYAADKVLLSTGAWTSQFLSDTEEDLKMTDEDRVERQVTAAGVCLAHFRLSQDEVDYYSKMPVLIYGGKGEVVPPTRDRLFKFTNAFTFKNTITTPNGHSISAPREGDQSIVSDKLKTESIEIIRQRIPHILRDNRQVDFWRLCWDSISPDQNQLITRHPHPKLSNLYLAIGGSFHSWKFLPIIGKYIIKVIIDEKNGKEKDAAWAWKTKDKLAVRGAHEKAIPKRELRELD